MDWDGIMAWGLLGAFVGSVVGFIIACFHDMPDQEGDTQ